jgi:hypothetical protein
VAPTAPAAPETGGITPAPAPEPEPAPDTGPTGGGEPEQPDAGGGFDPTQYESPPQEAPATGGGDPAQGVDPGGAAAPGATG